MHFQIESRRFSVSIAARPLILAGQPCRAKIDLANGRIWLSDQLPRAQRRVKLFHELAHAWRDGHPAPRDQESEADDLAAFTDSMMEQYLARGGDAVLEALEPEEEAMARAGVGRAGSAMLASSIVHCGRCEAGVAAGSVVNGPARWSADHGAYVVERGVLCCVCDAVTIWGEAATAEGMPTGMIVPYPPPTVLTGGAAAAWIAEHQKKCRVVMA